MARIEFRRRNTEDEAAPYYVRIAAPGDTRSIAFSENGDSWAPLDRAIDVLRSGRVTTDRLFDRGNDCWFFRFKDAATDEVLFRSMPCPTEAAMEDDIAAVLGSAAAAPTVDDTTSGPGSPP